MNRVPTCRVGFYHSDNINYFMMKRTLIITGIIVVVGIIVLIVISKITSRKDVANLFAESEKGQIDIIGPEFTQSRNIRAMDIKITDMVPEGTEVKSGEYVATLDRTSFDNSLK